MRPGLTDDQPGLSMVATEIDDIDAGCLELADERRIVLLARRISLVHRLADAETRKLLAGLVGQAFAVGRLVVKDGDILASEMVRQEGAGHGTLLVVAPAGAKDIVEALLRQQRVSRGRRNLQHTFLVIGLGGGDRGRGAKMPGHEDHALVDHLVSHGHRLLGLAAVVANFQHQFLAEHATGGVNVGHGHLGAAHHLLAENCVLPRHRPSGGNDDLVGDGRRRQGGSRAQYDQRMLN